MAKKRKKSAKRSAKKKRPSLTINKMSTPIKILKRDQRYERFCKEYVIDLNGTRAAIAAGYSKKTARSKASQLLTKGNIKARIAELQKDTAKKLDLTAEIVLAELKKIGFNQGEETRDRIRALELCGKHLKLFTDRVQLEGLDGLAEKLEEARKRVGK